MTDSQPPIVNIEGSLVSLGPLRRDHIPLYLRWINDFGTTRMLGFPPGPVTLEQETAWYDGVAGNTPSRSTNAPRVAPSATAACTRSIGHTGAPPSAS